MNHKEVKFYFGNSLAIFETKLHDTDIVSIALSELQMNEEKSTHDHEYLETICTTEVFIDVEEAKSIVNALQFLINEADAS